MCPVLQLKNKKLIENLEILFYSNINHQVVKFIIYPLLRGSLGAARPV
jgi:hypothetical protein